MVQAAKFTRAGPYVNMSRVSPDIFVKATSTAPWGEKIRFRESMDNNPVGIMLLVIEDCEVLHPGYVGFGDPFNVRHIIGLPVNMIFEYNLDTWGSVLGFVSINAPVSHTGIAFSTQGEGKGMLLSFSNPSRTI